VAFFSRITEEPNVEALAKVFQTNTLGPFYMVNAVVPHMPKGGRIINVSSTNSKRGNAHISTYAASKAALDNLTWTWAEEVIKRPLASWKTALADACGSQLGRSRGLTVNSVAPGPVQTDLYPEGLAEELMQPEIALTRAADRAGTIEDIGNAVLLLVQEKSRWITGQYIGVNGGVTY